VKLNTLLNLLLDGLLRPTIRGVESLITAKSTATRTDFSIPIGTTKARINADFLHPSAELLREITAVAVKTSVVAPGVNHSFCFCHKTNKTLKTIFLGWESTPTGCFPAARRLPRRIQYDLSFALFCMFCD
jgi:hypothetical protein